MDTTSERRFEERLHYHWPIWFAEDANGDLCQGQMSDISSRGAAFTCYANHYCPYPGEHIAARFSVPRYGQDGSFDMVDFVRTGHVCRVDDVNSMLRRIAVQFAEPLPFHPGEQETGFEIDSVEEAESLMV